MTKITRETFPIGTRVIDRTQHRYPKVANEAVGVVTGWHKNSIGVRWDSGGTSVTPAHHGGLDYEPTD